MNSNPKHPKIEAAKIPSHRNSVRLIVMAISEQCLSFRAGSAETSASVFAGPVECKCSGIGSCGGRSLANFWDVSLDAPLHNAFSITTYYAFAWETE